MVVEVRVLHREGRDAGEAHGALSPERVSPHEERSVMTSARKAPEGLRGHIARHRHNVAADALVGMILLAARHAGAAAATSVAPAPASANDVHRTFQRVYSVRLVPLLLEALSGPSFCTTSLAPPVDAMSVPCSGELLARKEALSFRYGAIQRQKRSCSRCLVGYHCGCVPS